MLSTRNVKAKIRTVRSIQQICRAMKTVASIRLRRAEQRLAAARPYRGEITTLTGRVAAITQEHPFLIPRPVVHTGLVVVTSDRGLAGGYNANVVRKTLTIPASDGLFVIPVGRRGLAQLSRRGYQMLDGLPTLGGEPEIGAVWRLAGQLGQFYLDGTLDEVVMIYSRFLGGTRSEVVSRTLLPITAAPNAAGDAIFEPSPAVLLGGLMDRYLRSQVLTAILEASASEHGARVAAMTNASDNAEDMIRDLTLAYNKARQAGITRELSEIVSTSEATA